MKTISLEERLSKIKDDYKACKCGRYKIPVKYEVCFKCYSENFEKVTKKYVKK